MAKGKLKRLWSVTVHCAFTDESGTYTIEALDDQTARGKAIPKFITETNAAQDKRLKQDISASDVLVDRKQYRHITEKDIDYCECELENEWMA